MEDIKDVKSIARPPTPSLEIDRRISSLRVERDMLRTIMSVFNLKDGELDYHSKILQDNLTYWYNSWQGNPSKQGLSAGTLGEALIHLVGFGILHDLPEPYVAKNGSSIGVKKGGSSVKVTIEVKDTSPAKYCDFVFDNNPELLDKRMGVLNREMENLRKNI